MVTWKFIKYNASAEKVANEIDSLATKTPQTILDYAKHNQDSELHKCFEWNDTVAAEKYRLYQARQIVLNLVYTNDTKKEEPTKLRVFYRQESTNDYQPTKLLVKNEDSYKQLLNKAKSELRAFKEKYKMLTELEEIFDLID